MENIALISGDDHDSSHLLQQSVFKVAKYSTLEPVSI